MLLIIYSYLRQAAKKRHCEGQRGKTEKSWAEKRKTNTARRRGTSREPRKKGRARNFPYMGTRVRARRPAGRRSIGRRIDPGPRVIVTSRVDRAAARHDRPRKNAETHERGQGKRPGERDGKRTAIRDNGEIGNKEKCQKQVKKGIKYERERERGNKQREKKMSEKERNATGLEETRDADERSFERGAKERERRRI